MKRDDREKVRNEPVGGVPTSPGDQAPPGTPGTGEVPCPECHGSGRRHGDICHHCGGSGRIVAGVGGA